MLRRLGQGQRAAAPHCHHGGEARKPVPELDQILPGRPQADEIFEQLEPLRGVRLGGVIDPQLLEIGLAQVRHSRNHGGRAKTRQNDAQ